MSDVLVVGGGFAGVWAAAAAARVRELRHADFSVTLVSPGDRMVIRPRLYEEHPEEMAVRLERILQPIGVNRIHARVTGIDTADRTVRLEDAGESRSVPYRQLVLAAGSRLRRPEIAGAALLHDVDTQEGAVALAEHLHRLTDGPGEMTGVVVGAGFAGIEIAGELVGRLRDRAVACGADPAGVRVVLVERAGVVGPDLGPGPRPQILEALAELGIEALLEREVAAVEPDRVLLTDGTEIAATTVVWAAGVAASPLTADVPGTRDHLGRLEVTDDLRVIGVPDVYAAGDTAAAIVDGVHRSMPSCQHAIPLGKFAGHNAAAALLGEPGVPFATSPYVTCLDLGSSGAVFTTGFERTVQLTGADAKQRKKTINQDWIYPPVDDREEILRVADYRVGTRK